MTPDQIAEAVRRYRLGFSMEEIGNKLGEPEKRVRHHLIGRVKFRGVAGATESRLVTKKVIKRARGMLATHLVGAIAVELDVPKQALRKALGLKNADFTPRVTLALDHTLREMRRQTERTVALLDAHRAIRLQECGIVLYDHFGVQP